MRSHTWEIQDCRDQVRCRYSWRAWRALHVFARSALPRRSGMLLTLNVPRERFLYSRDPRRNSIETQFIAYQQRPHGAPYASATRSPWTKRGRAMLRAERLENRNAFGLTSWKIANQDDGRTWVSFKTRWSLIPKDPNRFRIPLIEIHFKLINSI